MKSKNLYWNRSTDCKKIKEKSKHISMLKGEEVNNIYPITINELKIKINKKRIVLGKEHITAWTLEKYSVSPIQYILCRKREGQT